MANNIEGRRGVTPIVRPRVYILKKKYLTPSVKRTIWGMGIGSHVPFILDP